MTSKPNASEQDSSQQFSEESSYGKPSIMDVFSTRPVLSIVLSLGIVLMGLRAALELPILQFPKISSSSLVITTPYIGASAEVVQGFITEPIERAASSVPGVDYVDSRTTPGVSTVTVWLNLNEDSTRALAELSSRLDQIRFELPEGAEDPSVQVVRADRPIAIFYLTVNYDEDVAGISRIEATDYLARNVLCRNSRQFLEFSALVWKAVVTLLCGFGLIL